MFEVIFQGKVVPGAELSEVRQNLGRMFKADEAKLNALFSGKTVVIKSGLDQATAQKYLAALTKAGAQAEIRSLEKKPEPAKPQNPASFVAKDFSKPSLNAVAQAKAEAKQTEEEEKPTASESVGIPVPEVTETSGSEEEQAMAALAEKEAKAKAVAQQTAQLAAQKQAAERQAKAGSVTSQGGGDFSLAPTGSMILPDEKPKEVEAPKTDHLSVKPMEGYLVDPKPEEDVEVPDISHLKLKDE